MDLCARCATSRNPVAGGSGGAGDSLRMERAPCILLKFPKYTLSEQRNGERRTESSSGALVTLFTIQKIDSVVRGAGACEDARGDGPHEDQKVRLVPARVPDGGLPRLEVHSLPPSALAQQEYCRKRACQLKSR